MRLNYIEPHNFVENFHVQAFIQFLGEIINGKRAINCHYFPKKDKKNAFSIKYFNHGLEQYSWAGQSFTETQCTITALTKKLRESIVAKNELFVLQNALSILEWGQVYRGCIDWLVIHSQNNQLTNIIGESSAVLDGSLIKSKDEFTELFDRGGIYRCNSGTTKIFALQSQKSIIYDGRVACAIGMLVHDYLIENAINHLPADLNFLMDASQRNTSKYTSKPYQYASKTDSENALFNQAISSLKINLILQSVVKLTEDDVLGFSSTQEQLRAIEAVLFMIGYEVNKNHYEKTGKFLL